MNWYYADNEQQKGPIADWDLSGLVRSGVIKPDTLVWKEGLPDWQPLRVVRPDLVVSADAPMIGGMAVPEQQKDVLVQQMREGVLPSNIPGHALHPGTPEYIGFWWRFLARFLDALIIGAVSCIFLMPLGMISGAMGAQSSKNVQDLQFQLTQMVVTQSIAQLVELIITCVYFTWMVGQFGATVGKMALGFKVVTADGGKVTYFRAFGRWAADQLLEKAIGAVISGGPAFLVFVAMGGNKALEESKTHPEVLMGILFAVIGIATISSLVGAFPYWMAGFDPEKRALHDRICATRVIRK